MAPTDANEWVGERSTTETLGNGNTHEVDYFGRVDYYVNLLFHPDTYVYSVDIDAIPYGETEPELYDNQGLMAESFLTITVGGSGEDFATQPTLEFDRVLE
jgi:hypothetical protein